MCHSSSTCTSPGITGMHFGQRSELQVCRRHARSTFGLTDATTQTATVQTGHSKSLIHSTLTLPPPQCSHGGGGKAREGCLRGLPVGVWSLVQPDPAARCSSVGLILCIVWVRAGGSGAEHLCQIRFLGRCMCFSFGCFIFNLVCFQNNQVLLPQVLSCTSWYLKDETTEDEIGEHPHFCLCDSLIVVGNDSCEVVDRCSLRVQWDPGSRL